MPTDAAYKARQAACRCLSPQRRGFISAAINFADGFNDGAFMAYMEERGIEMEELECFSIQHDCAKT